MNCHSDAPELKSYSDDELLSMVATILAEPGELNELGEQCLQTINNEFILREAKRINERSQA
jgi:hypothetical protein